MRKKLLSLLCAGAMVASTLTGVVACGGGEQGEGVHPGGDITVWVSDVENVKTVSEAQIAKFITDHPIYANYNVTVEAVGEGKAATQMIASVQTGADIFCFAQDQMTRLMRANALSGLGKGATKTITENNDAGSVKAATYGNTMYAYPITSDNGYFLYYDKSKISEDHVDSLEDIISDCDAAGSNFTMAIESSAWYLASFFFGAGCKSEWTEADDGKSFVKFEDDWNSDQGLIALKKAIELKDNTKVVVDKENGFNYETSAAVISGTWDSGAAKAAYGANFGVAKLPKFTGADGKKYQMGSYSGYKLMGVKPHEDAKVQSFCQNLAIYLSGEECQIARYQEFGWGPSNVNAKQNDAVKSDVALLALEAQSPYSVPQGQIPDDWWSLATGIITDCKGGKATTDAQFMAALKTYEDACKELVGKVDEEIPEDTPYGITGAIASKELNWDADLEMVEDPAGTWITKEAIVLAAGDEFKARQVGTWKGHSFGVGTENYKITADNAGTYKIKLVLTITDGVATAGELTLVPVTE